MRFFFSGDKSSFDPIAQTVTIDFNVSLFSRSRVVWTSCLVVPATYEIYLCDKQSVPVSDVQTVTADKTGEPQDRVFKIRFTLKSADFDGNAVYYLNVVDKEAGTIIERTEFSVKIAFANDFDF